MAFESALEPFADACILIQISHWQAQDASEHSPNEEEFRATSPVSELTMEEIQAEWKPVFRKRARDW
jgi:hypothetical protein